VDAVVGILCVEIAVLNLGVMLLIFRNPDPPSWTHYTLSHEVVAIGTVAIASFGMADIV